MSQLEDSKICESSLRREISRKNQQISTLQQQLEERTNNLQHSFRKLESLSEQCEKTIVQQTKIAVNFVIQFYMTSFWWFSLIINQSMKKQWHS